MSASRRHTRAVPLKRSEIGSTSALFSCCLDLNGKIASLGNGSLTQVLCLSWFTSLQRRPAAEGER